MEGLSYTFNTSFSAYWAMVICSSRRIEILPHLDAQNALGLLSSLVSMLNVSMNISSVSMDSEPVLRNTFSPEGIGGWTYTGISPFLTFPCFRIGGFYLKFPSSFLLSWSCFTGPSKRCQSLQKSRRLLRHFANKYLSTF